MCALLSVKYGIYACYITRNLAGCNHKSVAKFSNFFDLTRLKLTEHFPNKLFVPQDTGQDIFSLQTTWENLKNKLSFELKIEYLTGYCKIGNHCKLNRVTKEIVDSKKCRNRAC